MEFFCPWEQIAGMKSNSSQPSPRKYVVILVSDEPFTFLQFDGTSYVKLDPPVLSDDVIEIQLSFKTIKV